MLSYNTEQWKDFFKQYPDLFFERYLRIKLRLYQKIVFRTVYRHRFSKFIDRYFIIIEQLKRNKQKENYIRGHRLEKIFYEDACEINEEAINHL